MFNMRLNDRLHCAGLTRHAVVMGLNPTCGPLLSHTPPSLQLTSLCLSLHCSSEINAGYSSQSYKKQPQYHPTMLAWLSGCSWRHVTPWQTGSEHMEQVLHQRHIIARIYTGEDTWEKIKRQDVKTVSELCISLRHYVQKYQHYIQL